MARTYLFTSESVSEGHPDKVADQISDAILDGYLALDPYARVACETLVTNNKVILAGEVRAREHPDYEKIVRGVIRRIGYAGGDFDPDTVQIESLIHDQSAEIALGVDGEDGSKEGAGDQGIMFGYAADETLSYMPAPIFYAHRLLEELAERRHGGDPRLLPDAKSQVTLKYEDGEPVNVHTIVVSHQHTEDTDINEMTTIIRTAADNIFPAGWLTQDTKFIINPAGAFTYGGPGADAGLTGRKIIVDTYGGTSRHGGGAFSGKDPSKVDRSAAYAARYLAKNVVAAGLAKCCEIQLCYAIGMKDPIAIYLDTFGTAKEGLSDDGIAAALREVMDLTPKGIRQKLALNQPMYEKTASYGHFGRQPGASQFTWENLDLVDRILEVVKG